MKVNRIKNDTPDWFDIEILEKIDLRKKLLRKFKKTNLNIDWELYTEARNSVFRAIKNKKENFITKTLEENVNNPKKLWDTIKSLGLPSKHISNGRICLNHENIYNLTYVKNYYEKINPNNKIFSFNKIKKEEVFKILSNTKIDKAAGIDCLTGRFLKDGAVILSEPITQICNLSVKISVVPEKFKIAKLKPLFKKGSSTDPKNYRPISLLPLISKVLEKIIHDQTQSFLRENELLYKFQSGFRSHHSTDFCLSYLTNKIMTGFDSGLLTGMILIDLQKAFDTIDHDILLNKMKYIGFSSETIKWFKSYLTNRTFIVSIDNCYSNPGNLTCGVPQGSILGPLLFLIYINDMQQASDSMILLYADDSCLIYQDKNVKEIENRLNKDFGNLCNWFIDNKLSVHLGEDKTKAILFCPKNKSKVTQTLELSYKDNKIKQYSNVLYLGCILDESMSGELMALRAIKKINDRLKFLYRKKSFLSPALRRLLCNAIIQPHFDYACSSWYFNLTQAFKKKLQVCQNKCIRFCLQKGNMHHIGFREFELINWLNVDNRVIQIILCNVFKFLKGTCPHFMSEIFSFADNININTRSSSLRLIQPRRKTKKGLNCISYKGPSYWNKIPKYLKLSNSLNTFKHKLKQYFLKENETENGPLFSY